MWPTAYAAGHSSLGASWSVPSWSVLSLLRFTASLTSHNPVLLCPCTCHAMASHSLCWHVKCLLFAADDVGVCQFQDNEDVTWFLYTMAFCNSAWMCIRFTSSVCNRNICWQELPRVCKDVYPASCAGACCSIMSHAYSVAFTRISFISSITNPAQLTEFGMYSNFAGMSAVSGDVHMDMEGQERSSRCSSDSGASGHSPSPGSCLLDCSVAANPDDVQPSAGCLHHLGPVLHVGPAQLCCCLLGGWTGSLLRRHPARCSRAHRSAP